MGGLMGFDPMTTGITIRDSIHRATATTDIIPVMNLL